MSARRSRPTKPARPAKGAGGPPPPGDVDPRIAARQFDRLLREVTPRLWVVPAIIGINVALFALMVGSGVDPLAPDVESVVGWGASYGPRTLGGEPWRLLASTFVHHGAIHLACNMFALWIAGRRAERIFGQLRFAAIYVCAGLAGSAAGVAVHPQAVSAGASGAVLGVYGALAAFLVSQRGVVPPPVGKRLGWVAAAFVAYNVVVGLRGPNVDLVVLVGGLAGGAIAGRILARPLDPARPQQPRRPLSTMAATFAIVFVVTGVLTPPPEFESLMTDFSKVEQQSVDGFNTLLEDVRANRITDHAFIDGMEQKVLPPWRRMQARLAAAGGRSFGNPNQTRLVGVAGQYAREREDIWTRMIRAVRTHDIKLLDETMQASAAAGDKFKATIAQQGR